MFRSRSSRKFLSRLIIAGAIILIGFPLGVIAYLHTLTPPPHVPVKNIEALISQASSHDTTIVVSNKKFIIKKGTVIGWTESYTRDYTGKKDIRFTDVIETYVLNLAKNTNRTPVDAKFTIDNGTAIILTAAQNGQELNLVTATNELKNGLLANKLEITLTPEVTEPAITAEKINSLGINDRIAIGQSDFTGSTLARIQNIKVSSKKYNGLIIKPNETFSFNTLLGDVDASTGYLPEKVIKAGRIEYEYGGGICQVSTTLFRAAILAGFPIVERKPHAFPVHYYEPQGFDATIYPGSSDLRFINDTPGPVLVQTHITGKNLIFEIYGKSDGRVVTMAGPYQYDIQPDGAMKAYFTRTINFADGASTSKTFYSNYKSPNLFPTDPNPYQ